MADTDLNFTPAMIAAGCSELAHYRYELDNEEEVVKNIFLAMVKELHVSDRIDPMPSSDNPSFGHNETGMTRFPPNVEQITIKCESARVWLIARRNDIELRFALTKKDCRHLCALLSDAGDNLPSA